MPSTFTTDPIGPRSIDEMLDVVYSRAEHHRKRRTVQRVGIAAVAVLVASAGVVTLRGGDPEAHVRVVDRPTTEEQAITPPDVEASMQATPGTGASGSVHSSGSRAKKEADKPREVDATVQKPEGVPALPADGKPALETWGAATDDLNDANPGDWYYDIAATSMQFDSSSQMVIFTTKYRLPDAPIGETRAARNLQSLFGYQNTTFEVRVSESGNELGEVVVDDWLHCGDQCSTGFDVASSTLQVFVPLAKLNEAVTQRRAQPLASGADIMSVEALTIPAGALATPADESEVE